MLCWVQSHPTPLHSAFVLFVCMILLLLLPPPHHRHHWLSFSIIRCYVYLLCIYEMILKRFFLHRISIETFRNRCLFSITQSIPCWSIDKPTTQMIIGCFRRVFFFSAVFLPSFPHSHRLDFSNFFPAAALVLISIVCSLPNRKWNSWRLKYYFNCIHIFVFV